MKKSKKEEEFIKMMLPTIIPLAEKIANLKYIPGSKAYFLSPMGFIYQIDEVYQHSVLLIPKKPSPQNNGYCNASLYFYDGHIEHKTIHPMMMEAYFGKRPYKAQIHHKDHHRWNNSLSNLEYVSPEVHYDLHATKDKYDAKAEEKLFDDWWQLWKDEYLEIFF